MVDDLVHLLSPPVEAAQDGPVLVGHLGPGGDDLAHQGAETGDMLFGPGPVAGVGEVAVEEGAQVGVEGVPVQPGGLLEIGVVGKHPPMLRPRARPWRATPESCPERSLGKLIRMVNDDHDRRRPRRSGQDVRPRARGRP